MKSSKFFTVPYDVAHTSEMRYVRKRCGGLIAFGRWMALLGIMYEQDGKVDPNDPVMREVVMEELEIAEDEELDALLDALGSVDFVSAQLLAEHGVLTSNGVLQQVAYKRERSAAGKKGGEASEKKGAKQ